MNWHTFFGAFGNPRLWYLPTAYFTVAVVQLGYLGWIAVQWFRVPRRSNYSETPGGLR